MKNVISKILFLFLCSSLFLGSSAFAYPTDPVIEKQASQFVRLIQKKLASFPADRAEKLELLIHAKLVQIQNTLIGKTDGASLQKNALYESVRRKLLSDSFDSQETVFDDGIGAIWTHASKGFSILYNPTSTPTIGNLASGTKNILINGSYFSRQDGVEYHSGLLWSDGVRWSEMVY